MIYLKNLIVCLFLAVFQTALLPKLPFSETVFDLGICYVISLCLYYPYRVVFLFSLILGIFMDSLSGGAMGLYLSVYFWLAVSIRWVMNFFKINSLLIAPIVVLAGILFQHAVFLGALFLVDIGAPISMTEIRTIGIQALAGFFLGPFVVHALGLFLKNRYHEFSNRPTPAREPH